MTRKTATPRELAKRAKCETDDVLIHLWDAGIEYPTGPDSVIRAGDVARAEHACGLANPKEKTQVTYWMTALSLDREGLVEAASRLGIQLGTNERRLPKGALAKFERQLVGAITTQKSTSTAGISRSAPASLPRPAFEWSDIGHPKETMQFLEATDVENVHFAIAEDFRNSPDPISPAGVRDSSLLASAADRPKTGLGHIRKYPTVELAAAALMHSIVHNHAFYNGNKRTGLVSMLSFLDQNGLTLTCDEAELFRWTLRVASHALNPSNLTGDRNDIEVHAMARWIMEHSRLIDRGERVITWNVLRQRLTALGCSIEFPGNRGGRVHVTRGINVETRGLLRNKRQIVVARYVLPYGGDGRQVGRTHIKYLRRELQLSDDFGVDSAAFYGTDQSPIDEFIRIYRKTLVRLARV